MIEFRHVLLLTFALQLAACGGEDSAPPSQAQTQNASDHGEGGRVDLTALERLEDATESLANMMLELSVEARSGDAERLVGSLSDPIQLGLPTPGVVQESVRSWLKTRHWDLVSPHAATSAQATKRFQAFLDVFHELEDVRFKLTDTRATDAGLSARFKGFLVGRNAAGQREWLRFKGDLEAREEADGWRLTTWVFDKVHSMVATVDLFSECGAPAGVAANSPAYADRAEGLRSHGAATADVNGDGLLDIFTTGEERNFLYLNQGDGTFRDVAREARVQQLATPVIAPLFVDVDADGDLDLFITAIGPQVLLENRLVPDGKLTFRDISGQAGVAVPAHGFSVAAGDVDGDGLVDLYVASYNDYGTILPDSWEQASNGTPNLLFVNQGGGRFKERARELGAAGERWSYGTTLADVDADGRLDILVANDFGGPMNYYLNTGNTAAGPRFVDVAGERGLGGLGYGMGLSLGDFDNDGDLDLHLTKMSSTAGKRILGRDSMASLSEADTLSSLADGNSVFENLGDGRFREVTAEVGPLKGGWAWGGGFFDIDNDGHDDVYTPNGFISGKSLADT